MLTSYFTFYLYYKYNTFIIDYIFFKLQIIKNYTRITSQILNTFKHSNKKYMCYYFNYITFTKESDLIFL